MSNHKYVLLIGIIVFSIVAVGIVLMSSQKSTGNLKVYVTQGGYDSSGRHYTTYYLSWNGEETNITLSYVPFGTWTVHVYNGKTFSETAKEPYPCFITYDGKELRLDP